MRFGRRLIAALAVAMLCAPGTFVRTDVPRVMSRVVEHERIQGSSPTSNPGWEVEGVWHYRGEGRYFGGFSALMVLTDQTLRAFSDRGVRLTIYEPDADRPLRDLPMALMKVEDGRDNELWDIESATRDPVSGTYWLGYEYVHAIHRFNIASEADGLRDLEGEVDWYVNGGLEAMVRLSDGRFLALPERGEEGLLYPQDPVEGGEPITFDYVSPEPGYAVTDMAQLPDGRVLLVMRALAWDKPPFAALIAIADIPDPASAEPWAPTVTLDLEGVIPAENYEGIAVQPREDGRVIVWLLSDDNFSVFQRTLLAKLVFDPTATED